MFKKVLASLMLVMTILTGVALGVGVDYFDGSSTIRWGTMVSTANSVAYRVKPGFFETVTCSVVRTGTATLTVNLQGSIVGPSTGFANLSSDKSVTDKPDTHQFGVADRPNEWYRFQCLTGCDVTNTITPRCVGVR